MKMYEFTLHVVGSGETPEEAWDDVLESISPHFDDGDYSIPEPQDIKLLDEWED